MKNVCLILTLLLMVHLNCDAADQQNRIGGEVYEPTTLTMILWDIRTAVHDGRYTDHLADIAAQLGCYELAELIGGKDNA